MQIEQYWIEILATVISGVVVPALTMAIARWGKAQAARAESEAAQAWWHNVSEAAMAAVLRVESEIVEPAFEDGEIPDWDECRITAMEILSELMSDVLTEAESATMIEAAYQRMVSQGVCDDR